MHDSWPPTAFPQQTPLSLLCLSPQRPYKKTLIKDHNREWAESGLLWGKLIYLYSVSAGLNTHCFSFSLTLHTGPPPPTNSPFPSPTNALWWFPCTSMWHHICHLLPGRKSEEDSSMRTEICRNDHFLFRLWPSLGSGTTQPDVPRLLSLKGRLPEPVHTHDPPWPRREEIHWRRWQWVKRLRLNEKSPQQEETREAGLVCINFDLLPPPPPKKKKDSNKQQNCLSCKQGQSA